MKLLAKIIATFFGVGFTPLAPGTAASLITVILYKYLLYRMSWPFYLGLVFVIYIAGVWTSTQYSLQLGQKDPGKVVIDEVAGQLLALFMLPPTWFLMIMSFFLFRFFDIFKPPIIKKAESFSRGWGIMLDDIVAGIYTSIIINLYLLIK